MAWLLATDYDDRKAKFTRAKKIYGLRSKIVHGSSADAAKVSEAAEELIEWLRLAVISLLTTHASMLDDDSRAQRLFLNEPDS